MQYNDLRSLAQDVASSGMFSINTPQQAMTLMVLAQAEGLHPGAACRDYNLIGGKPSMKAEAMLRRFQESGGRVEWLVYSDEKVEAKFTHPQGGSVTIDWTLERAKKAGLADKAIWKNYPRNMLRARVVSEGVRMVFPAATGGVYTPEEVQDMQHSPAVEVVPWPEPKQILLDAPKFDLEEALKQIHECQSMDSLKEIFQRHYLLARDTNQSKADLDALKKAKDEKKTTLE